MSRAAALLRTCPKCGAPPHMSCMGTRGPRTACHAQRHSKLRDIGYRISKESQRARSKRCDVLGWVYFIGTVSADKVKIGWSKDSPERRLAQLQTGNGEQLHLYGAIPGTQRDERALHDKFLELHVRGEWFHFEKAIWDIIPEAVE